MNSPQKHPPDGAPGRSCPRLFGSLFAFLVLWVAVVPARGQGVITECTQAALEAELAFGGEITFDCDGVIVLTNTMVISIDTTLDATGHSIVISTITGTNATNAVRLFEVDPEVTFTIVNLKLADGRSTNGAAIFNNGGYLSALSCVFSNNQAVGLSGRIGKDGRSSTDSSGKVGENGGAGTHGLGGAIYNIGSTYISSCSFLTNAAGGGIGGNGGAGGSGRHLGGNGGNGARGGGAYGGAIFNGGDLLIEESSLFFNFALGGAGGTGGIGGDSGAYIGYTGRGGAGGVAQGGAVYNASTGTVEIVNSTLALNQAQGGDSAGAGTGAGGSLRNGLAGGQAVGGAVGNFGINTLVNSTFFANAAAGGAGGDGATGVFRGTKGGNGGSAWGGGVYNYRRSMATNCSFSDGGALGGTNGVGGTGAYPGKNGNRGASRGGNVSNAKGKFYLKNCVIAYGSPGTNGYGVFVNSGFNLSSDRSIKLRGAGSLVNTNPMLGILDNNGGPTPTLALGDGSPAINAGDPYFVLPTDQRGVPRPGDSRGDIGAYEYGLFLTAPTIVTSPQDATVQVGGTVTFSVVAQGDAPLLYQWRRNTNVLAGETGPTLTIVSATTGNAGAYEVIVSNNSGSVTSDAATLRVLRPVAITVQPTDQMTAPGASATFGVTATGDAPVTYQWFQNGSPILGATLSTLTVADVQPEQTGEYQVLVANAFSSVLSAVAILTVGTTPPEIVVPPSDVTVVSGEDAVFSATVSGTPPWRYLWFFNDTTLIAQLQSSDPIGILTIPDSQPPNEGQYRLVVTNFSGAVTSALVTLTVQIVAPTITQQPADSTVGTGDEAVFSVEVSGSAPRTFQWYFNDTNRIDGATNSTLLISDAQPDDVGSYRVAVTNVVSGVLSDPASLQVTDVPPFIRVQPESITTNSGARVTFTVVAGGSRPLTYQWYFDNGVDDVLLMEGETNATLILINVTAELAGFYYVEVANAFGTDRSEDVYLEIDDEQVLLENGSPAPAALPETRRQTQPRRRSSRRR